MTYGPTGNWRVKRGRCWRRRSHSMRSSFVASLRSRRARAVIKGEIRGIFQTDVACDRQQPTPDPSLPGRGEEPLSAESAHRNRPCSARPLSYIARLCCPIAMPVEHRTSYLGQLLAPEPWERRFRTGRSLNFLYFQIGLRLLSHPNHGLPSCSICGHEPLACPFSGQPTAANRHCPEGAGLARSVHSARAGEGRKGTR